jgi:hypothetical protein
VRALASFAVIWYALICVCIADFQIINTEKADLFNDTVGALGASKVRETASV